MPDMPSEDLRRARVPARDAGRRLDLFLVEYFSQYSRRQLSQAIRAGLVRVNGRLGRPGLALQAGDEIELPVWSKALPALARERRSRRDAVVVSTEVEVIFRDDDLLVVNKPPGMAVHGGAGQAPGRTLIDALRDDVLAGFGLVHRLDRDTTGVMALVRGEDLRRELVERFAAPDGGIQKVYEAVVAGVPEPSAGEIDLALTPPGHRGCARVDAEFGKPARTRYRTIEAFARAARLELEPLTGRTHQLRAHLAAIGHALLVDPLYARRRAWRIPDPRAGERALYLDRTPLHARRLLLPHPRTGERLTFEAPLPGDMRRLLEILRVSTGRGRARGGLPPVAGSEDRDGAWGPAGTADPDAFVAQEDGWILEPADEDTLEEFDETDSALD